MSWTALVLIAPIACIGFQTFRGHVWVLYEENLPDVFLDAPQKLNAADMERCAKAVKMIADSASGL